MSEDGRIVISPEMQKQLCASMERFFCPGFIGPLPKPPTKEELAKRAEAFDRALKDPATVFFDGCF